MLPHARNRQRGLQSHALVNEFGETPISANAELASAWVCGGFDELNPARADSAVRDSIQNGKCPVARAAALHIIVKIRVARAGHNKLYSTRFVFE